MNKIIIVCSGFNQRAVIAFLRTLEKHGLDYAIIASSRDDTIFKTAYAKKVVVTRRFKHLSLDDLLDCIHYIQNIYGNRACIIAPSTEALNRFLLENQSNFEQQGINIPLVEKRLYEKISDKLPFVELCKHHSIVVPKEYLSIDAAKFPFVAKPKIYGYLNIQPIQPVPVIIENEGDLRKFMQKERLSDYFYQEYVGGESIYLLYYFFKDGTYETITQINIMQQPCGKSVIAARLTENKCSEISENFGKLFLSLSFFGMVMVEIKKDKKKCFMIEANPRFWGPSQLFVDAEYNLFDCFLYDNSFIDKKPSMHGHKDVRYFWEGGLTQTLKRGLMPTFHVARQIFEQEEYSFWRFEIYNRPDTIAIYFMENNS
jgi:predicted ATP-grasp superfamily ATP-dependent carboligase